MTRSTASPPSSQRSRDIPQPMGIRRRGPLSLRQPIGNLLRGHVPLGQPIVIPSANWMGGLRGPSSCWSQPCCNRCETSHWLMETRFTETQWFVLWSLLPKKRKESKWRWKLLPDLASNRWKIEAWRSNGIFQSTQTAGVCERYSALYLTRDENCERHSTAWHYLWKGLLSLLAQFCVSPPSANVAIRHWKTKKSRRSYYFFRNCFRSCVVLVTAVVCCCWLL